MDGQKVLEMLQPMREVLNDLEGAALDDKQLSAKTLLDMAEKLTAAELAIIEACNRELTGELDRLEAERADLMDPARFAPKKTDREVLPDSIQWALNSGDGVYRPTMKLEFTHFDAGHHGHKPEPIEANDVDHAFRIFSAVACALCQTEKIRAKVEDAHGGVVARFLANDDEWPSTDYPEVGDMVCSECASFWSLCDCDDGGFVPATEEHVDRENRDPEMIEAMNAYLASGEAKQPWIDREAFETLQGFAGIGGGHD